MTEALDFEDQSADEPEPEDESEPQSAGERQGRRKGTRDYQSQAVLNLHRARKSLNASDGEVGARSQLFVQSAIALALLDLAEAIRSTGGGPLQDGE